MPATSTSSATTPIQHLGEQGGYFSNWANYSWAFTGSAATTVQNGLSVTVIETVKAGQSAFNWLYGTVKTIATIVEIEAERHEVKQKMTAAATYTAAIGMQALDMLSDKVAEVGSAALTELQVQAGHAGQALLSGAEAGLVMAKDKALEVGSAALAELQVQAGHAGQALLSGAEAGLIMAKDKALEVGSAALAELQVQAGHAGQALLSGAEAGLIMAKDKALEVGSAVLAELQVQAGHAGQALLSGVTAYSSYLRWSAAVEEGVLVAHSADDELFMSATEYTNACEQVLMVGNDALNFAVMACA